MSALHVPETLPSSTPDIERNISIIIAWKDRREIAITLRHNSHLFARYNAEVIVVISGSSIEAFKSALGPLEISGIRYFSIEGSSFNKSKALNTGLFLAKSDNIFILDADIILTEDVIGPSLSRLSDSTFCGIEWVDELRMSPAASATAKAFDQAFGDPGEVTVQREVAVNFLFNDGKSIHQMVVREDLHRGAHSAPGLIVARKMHLLKIGGYNSQVSLWGWEDNDVLLRLQHVLGLKKLEIGRALHLSHGDDLRALPPEGAYISNMKNLAHFCSLYARGEFEGTYLEDVELFNSSIPVSDLT